MPTIRSLPSGYTSSCTPLRNSPPTSCRGLVIGWSPKAAARNARFLRAQPRDGFQDGQPFAVTLTLRDLPASHDAWQKLRRAFFKRLHRLGLLRAHWVVEFTRRGVPHLHCAIWLPEGFQGGAEAIVDAWAAVTAGHATLKRSQDVQPIAQLGGWLRYVGMHAGRGTKHYQRARAALPAGWQTVGRLWGYIGGPWVDPDDIEARTLLTFPEWWRFRRIARNLEVARARASGDPARVRGAERSLRCPDRRFSPVRPASVWTNREGEELDILRCIVGDLAERQQLVDQVALELCETVSLNLAELENRRLVFATAIDRQRRVLMGLPR